MKQSRIFSVKPIALAILALTTVFAATKSHAVIGTVSSSPVLNDIIADNYHNYSYTNDTFNVVGTPGVAQGIKISAQLDQINESKIVVIDGISWTQKYTRHPGGLRIIINGLNKNLYTKSIAVSPEQNTVEAVINLPPGTYSLGLFVNPSSDTENNYDALTRTRILNGVEISDPNFKPWLVPSDYKKKYGSFSVGQIAAEGFNSNVIPKIVNDFRWNGSPWFFSANSLENDPALATLDFMAMFDVERSNSCITYETKSLAASNDGCFISWELNNFKYKQGFYENNYVSLADWVSEGKTAFLTPASTGPFSAKATLQKINSAGEVVASSTAAEYKGIAANRDKPEFKQSKQNITTIIDGVAFDFNTANNGDMNSNHCTHILNNKLAEYMASRYDLYAPTNTICAIEFDHIPAGLKVEEGCTTDSCAEAYMLGDPTTFVDGALKFSGKILNINDITFKYHLSLVTAGTSTGNIYPIDKSPRGNFETVISGVTAFDAGITLTSTPTTVDGRAATKMLFTTSKPDVVLLDNASSAATVIAAGKVPVVIAASFNGVNAQADASGGVQIIAPLGMGATGGYNVNYTATVVDGAGVGTPVESGVKPIADKAPVLTALSKQNTYTVGQPMATPIGFALSDPDTGDVASMAVEVQPANGVVNIQDGKAIYTPKAGFFGTDTFSVLASDSFGALALKSATVSVVNAGPIAATVKAERLTGYAPLSTKLNLVITNQEDVKNVLRIEWQQSVAGSTEWKLLSSSSTPTITLNSIGGLNVRAVIYSKLTKAAFTTEPVSFVVTAAPMPNLSIKGTLSTVFAPTNLNLNLQPSTAQDKDLMHGRQYTYEWAFPAKVNGKGKGVTATAYIDAPGEYAITATVTDAYQQSSTFEYIARVEEMKPFEFSLGVRKGLMFERAPMTYMLRPTLKLGHPRDRVTTYTLKVDDQIVGTPSARLPGLVSGLAAGDHTIALSFETTFGITGTASAQVTVAENQAPVCTLKSKALTGGTSVMVSAACRDLDGKIKSMKWTVDGTELTKSSPMIIVDMKDKASKLVEVVVVDDSGVSGSASITIN